MGTPRRHDTLFCLPSTACRRPHSQANDPLFKVRCDIMDPLNKICALMFNKLDPVQRNQLSAADMVLAHVPPDLVKDVKRYIGPYEPNNENVQGIQQETTLLQDRNKPLSSFFETRKSQQIAFVQESVFIVLHRMKLHLNPQQMLLTRYHQTLDDEDVDIVDDVKLTREKVDRMEELISEKMEMLRKLTQSSYKCSMDIYEKQFGRRRMDTRASLRTQSGLASRTSSSQEPN